MDDKTFHLSADGKTPLCLDASYKEAFDAGYHTGYDDGYKARGKRMNWREVLALVAFTAPAAVAVSLAIDALGWF